MPMLWISWKMKMGRILRWRVSLVISILCGEQCPQHQLRHITSFRVGETPKIKPCTTCCSLYHCPFCQPSAFKPNEFHRVIPHIQSHLRSAVQNDEYVVYNCKLTCRDRPHYHCTYCDHLISRKDLFIKHLKACRKHTRTARVEAQTSATMQLQEPRSPAQSALTPTTSTPVVEPISSDVPERTSPGPLDPQSSSVAPETLTRDPTQTEKTTNSTDHGLVARPSNLDSEPLSPEVYSGPPTPLIETERTKGQKPLQRDPVPVQIQCNHCGIILNRKNFKVHMRRKHHAEYVAEENEEALRRYLANTRTDVPPWRRPTRVQCDLCGIRLNKKNFKKHMKRKHRVHVTPLDFQESLDRYLGEQGLLVVESSVLCSARADTQVTGGRERCREEGTTDLFLDIGVGGEQGISFSDASACLSLETDLVSQHFKGETVQVGMNPHRYHGLGKPHLLELPLESLLWIFRDVLRVDGKRAYWNLSLVCRTFHTILRNEIITKYSSGKRSDPESRQ
ncbi:uncharacterized protein LOC105021035 isoform X2 [Esox lucius]|uniref:uncharacterized protein LOC105021035 isoform X2 n=1 Tax=Esox lucius TaxID=8010 RepID=UPI001476FF02|nr:uncharacterized protein LOC105021035 isoform X2 [Esox lucius]